MGRKIPKGKRIPVVQAEGSSGLPAVQWNHRDLPVSAIEPGPFNMRQDFDEVELKGFAENLRSVGVLEPVLVRPKGSLEGESFELLAGERRWRAAMLAGLQTIPCRIAAVEDGLAEEIALAENEQRADLNPIEIARGLQTIAARKNCSQRELAERQGKSTSFVANHLRLLELPEGFQTLLISREITERHGRAVLAWKDYPELVEDVLEQLNQHLDDHGDAPTVAEFESQIRDSVREHSRPMGGHGGRMVWHPKLGRMVEMFEPTPEQESLLDIQEIGDGERRAMNVALWDELLASHRCEEVEEEGEKGSEEDEETGRQGDEEEDPDAARRKAEAEAAKWHKRLWAWYCSWLRYVIAEGLRKHDATYQGDRLAILALSTWLVGMGQEKNLVRAVESRVKRAKDPTAAVWKLSETEVPYVLSEILAGFFWDDSGESFDVPAEQLPAIAAAMELNLEERWMDEQAGPLSEAYWRLHDEGQLLRLAKELKVRVEVDPADAKRSRDYLVDQLLARRPDPNDDANAAAAKSIPLPKELAKIKPPRQIPF